jgi:GDP-L-fucose synthase
MTKHYSKVLVTGGSGFVGSALKNQQSDWIYLRSQDCNLTNYAEVDECFSTYKPDAIIHLAARVGGIKENANYQADFFDENILMNTNVIRAAHNNNVERVLSALSTCACPDALEKYPFSEESMFLGPPAITNFSYGYAKRVLHVQSCAYRKQYGRNYSTFCPSNLYGPGDNFDLHSSHFVAALINKVANRKNNTIFMWGSGQALRQHLYVSDLVKIIPRLLYLHNSESPLIIAPDENLSIIDACDILASRIGEDLSFVFNNEFDGQFRKDGSNKQLKKVLGDIDFTPFRVGVKEAYEWYKTS